MVKYISKDFESTNHLLRNRKRTPRAMFYSTHLSSQGQVNVIVLYTPPSMLYNAAPWWCDPVCQSCIRTLPVIIKKNCQIYLFYFFLILIYFVCIIGYKLAYTCCFTINVDICYIFWFIFNFNCFLSVKSYCTIFCFFFTHFKINLYYFIPLGLPEPSQFNCIVLTSLDAVPRCPVGNATLFAKVVSALSASRPVYQGHVCVLGCVRQSQVPAKIRVNKPFTHIYIL